MSLPKWLYADEGVVGLSGTDSLMINHDLAVVEKGRRVWGPYNYVAFWLADSININTWTIIGGFVANGLAWWEAWVCVWIGYVIVAGFIVISGRIGSTYHIGFPVIARASFGIFGGLWPVLNRGAMACVWYGVQCVLGGECFEIMFRAVVPSFYNMKNHLPESAYITSKGLTGFLVFWTLSLFAIYPPVHKIRYLFTVKSVIVPIAGVLFFIWAIVKAHGIGPIVKQSGSLHGSTRAWAWVSAIMSCIANFATLIVNNPDFTRFAKTPSTPFYPQLLTIPLGFSITSFIGVIVGSSSKVIYGESVWNPLDLLNNFLSGNPSHATRAGVFFIALAFALAQLGVNIAANSVSAGSDLTALLPKFLTIRRSGYICAIVGLIICPWNFLKSSSTFTSYLSAYSTFLSSIAGVIFSDYYFVRKGYYDRHDLYSGSSTGLYFYTLGVNWRAYVAYILGIVINVVGFAGAVGASVSETAQHMYDLNFFLGIIVASGSYWLLCRFFPVPGCGDKWPSEQHDEVLEEANVDDYIGEQYELGQGKATAAKGNAVYEKTTEV